MPDPEQVVYDALIDGQGYYPGQLAPRIVEALRNAGFDLPEPVAEPIPRVDENGWHYLIRYPAGTVVQCAGDWDVASKHLRLLRQLYDEQHRAEHGRPADSTLVLIGAYPPNAVGGPEVRGGVRSFGYSPNLIGNIEIDPSEWTTA